MNGPETLPYDLLEERYRLEALLGRGGMAAVYRALDTRLDRRVAIKILGDSPTADDLRFRSEVRTLARFSHPNLVRVLDAGEIDDRLYLVMELIDGSTLSERLRGGPLAPRDVAGIGAGIASALSYVHGEGIVHRDVKPGNILLDRRGVAYLADFGISRLLGTTGMTTTGQLIGTPAYLAPEQLHGTDVGPPADVYALGLVLLECLQGERAFSGTVSEMAASRMLRGPSIPASLGTRWTNLISAMTETDPARRIAVSEVAGGLSSWSPEEWQPRHGARSTVGAATTRRLTDRRAQSDRAGSGRESTRRPLALGVAAAIVALLVGLALGAALLGSGDAGPKAGARRPSLTANHASSKPSTRTDTVTVTVTRHTSPPVKTLAAASGQFVSRLVAGEARGAVSPQAGQQLLAQLQPLASSPQADSGQQIQQFDQLAQTFDMEVAGGQIVGTSTVSSLRGAIATLAAVLGTSVPSTQQSAPQLPPGQVQNPGQGHGHGHGNH